MTPMLMLMICPMLLSLFSIEGGRTAAPAFNENSRVGWNFLDRIRSLSANLPLKHFETFTYKIWSIYGLKNKTIFWVMFYDSLWVPTFKQFFKKNFLLYLFIVLFFVPFYILLIILLLISSRISFFQILFTRKI